MDLKLHEDETSSRFYTSFCESAKVHMEEDEMLEEQLEAAAAHTFNPNLFISSLFVRSASRRLRLTLMDFLWIGAGAQV